MKNNSACGKIVTIHDVPNTISLKDLQKKIRDKAPNCSIRAGLFWLPKRGKQGRALETERDFSKAKDEYTNANGEVKDLHLAVCMFDMPGNQINQNKRATKLKASLPATQLQGINTEIKLDSDDDEDERYQRYVEQFEKDTKPGNKKKQDNSEWNDTHGSYSSPRKKGNTSPFRSTTSHTVDRSYC